LAFAGLHLGDPPLVQDHAADQLDVEMPLPEGALGRLAAGGKGLDQDIVETGPVRDLLLERLGARPQRIVRELFQVLLQRIDRRDPRHVALDAALVRRAEQLAGNRADHAVSPCGPDTCRCRTLPNPMGRNRGGKTYSPRAGSAARSATAAEGENA